MLVSENNFLIQVKKPTDSTLNIKGLGGKEIVIDTDYNKFSHSCRIGKIFACPISISSEYINDTQINNGDTVVFHHFVCGKENWVPIEPGNIYRGEYFNIYAIIKDNTIQPIEDVIFVEPILEPEENLFSGSIQVKSQRELLPQQGKVFALSKKSKEAGLIEGDHIFFTHNANYEMKVVGADLWRMRLRNITLVIRDEKPICISSKILIREIKNTEEKPLFCKTTLQLDGQVIEVGKDARGVRKGDTVNYYNTIGGSVNHQGKTYAMVEPRHINYTTSFSWIDMEEVKYMRQ